MSVITKQRASNKKQRLPRKIKKAVKKSITASSRFSYRGFVNHVTTWGGIQRWMNSYDYKLIQGRIRSTSQRYSSPIF